MKRREFLKVFCVSSLPLAYYSCTSTKKFANKKYMIRDEWDKSVPKHYKNNPAFKYIEDNPDLLRVLLIGDSISIGYTEPTRELLKGKVNVHRIPENGGNTDKGLEILSQWLRDEQWDVIHFNWGLHDLKHYKDGKLDSSGKQLNSLENYETNLEALVKRLKSTKAKLIWANTTPVPEGSNGRVAGDAKKYNEIAESVMKRNRVPVNDLFNHVHPNLEKYQKPQNVHFTPEGSKFLAEKVAEEILSLLNLK
jgi:lysophospholipase L1-like esterase